MGGTPVIEEDPDAQVEWVSWEGRPPEKEFKKRKPGESLKNYEENHKPLAAKYNVSLNPADSSYRTTNAHITTYYARDMDRFKEFRNRIYKARWVENLNLESPNVLAQCGQEVGLDGGEIRKVVNEKRYLSALHSQRAQGKSLGIFGIPSFVIEGKIFWGKDVIDDVKKEVKRVKKERLEKQKK